MRPSPPRHESRPQFQLGAHRPLLQCAACFLDTAACFARLASVSARSAACSFSATGSGSTCSFSTMSGASVRSGARIPRNLLAANGLQVLRMLSGDHHGMDFLVLDRSVRSLNVLDRYPELFCCVRNTAVCRIRPRAARVESVVFSRSCNATLLSRVLLLRSSWHSMIRPPWHSMALRRRFTRALVFDKLFACPRADPRVHFRTLLQSSAALARRCAGWFAGLTSTTWIPSSHCAWRSSCFPRTLVILLW